MLIGHQFILSGELFICHLEFFVIWKLGCCRFPAGLWGFSHDFLPLCGVSFYFLVGIDCSREFQMRMRFNLLFFVLMSPVLLRQYLGNGCLFQHHRDLFPRYEILLILFACLRQGLALQPRLASTHWLASCLWFPSVEITTTHHHTWLSPKVLYFTFRFLVLS